MVSMDTAQARAARLPRLPQRRLDHIPGDYGWPLLGQTLPFLRDYHGLVQRQAARHGLVHRGSILFQRGVTLLGPQANEFVLRDQEHVFSSRAAWNPILERLFTDGLMLRDFADHKFHRRIMQQAFKKPALASYLARMNPRIAEGIGEWPEGETFSFFDRVKALLLDVGAQTFLGLEMGPEADRVNRSFIDAADASLALLRLPIPGTLWHRGMRGRRYLEQFMAGLIPAKRAAREADFFSELCRAADQEGENAFTEQDVANHMIFLLFAAHDTTTSTLCSLIYLLAQHPQWQDALAREIATIDAPALDYDNIHQLEKTGWVFRETLRLRPPLTTFPRRTAEEVTFQGHRLPRNTLVNLSPLFTHYMPEYWSEPERFDPERFSDQRAEHKRHPFQWIPFGGGHHKCVGLNFAELQTKTFLFHFLRRYRVSVAPGYQMPVQLVPLAMPKDGLPVRIEPR
ncbi:cytochrome P450 [Alloalcanivorax mobilis]|uniref:cytochrome P450 n=1 Tax=Alloalcanivorax mobilis TaxID=2019569 RepID=UPI000B5B3287|nr:cytochrome P450 [Alloalcanivorax mobilis]ASK35574.1 cytochrome P450 [Alcanivorax sp. N3-2A]|tara:strand:+ start:2893 stop:4263 length:1371 start_codon:yes stop_codon:yes gene_type:complete